MTNLAHLIRNTTITRKALISASINAGKALQLLYRISSNSSELTPAELTKSIRHATTLIHNTFQNISNARLINSTNQKELNQCLQLTKTHRTNLTPFTSSNSNCSLN